MKIRLYLVGIVRGMSIFALCLSLCACRSNLVTSTPIVIFGEVPAENSDALQPAHIIAGRVRGAQPGQRIVLYARTEGRWGVQPYSGEPFTKIEEGGGWSGSTQLGSYYAALLVEPGYIPPKLTESLPALGTGVKASAIVNDRGTPAVLPPPKTLNFS